AREPLEIVHAIVDAVDREIQPSGRGKHVFPFNSIHVSVLAPSREVRDRLETVLTGDSGLRRRIDDKLRSARCTGSDVDVAISYVGRPQKSWPDPEFHVKFAKVEASTREGEAENTDTARIEVTVFRGRAEKRNYSFVADRIDVGRCVEVKDASGRLIRTNHLAFAEG